MAVLLASTMLSLRRRGTTGTLRHLGARTAPVPNVEPAAALRALQRPGRLAGANCLAQSVALAVALEAMGHRPLLVLGCRRYDDGQWGAHAWVLVGEDVLDPRPSGPHMQLAQLEAATGWVPAPPRENRSVRE
jgi:hypothetical protein